MRHLLPALLLGVTTACGTVGIETLRYGNIDTAENPYADADSGVEESGGDGGDGGGPSGDNPPEITAFFPTEVDGGVRLDLLAEDLDDDLDGGMATIVCGSTQETYLYPFDFETDGGTYVVWDSSLFPREQQHSCTAKIEDEAGHESEPATAQWYREAWTAVTTEIGDSVGDVEALGEIELPAEITGNLTSTGGYNSGSALVYTGDEDRVKFRLADAGTHEIKLLWTSNSDFDLWLYSESNAELAYSISTSATESISYAFAASTNYVVAVNGWSGDPGDWQLRID